MNEDVLVIDDEAAIRKLLRVALTSQGYGVREAASGAEGLAAAGLKAPDLIILDLGLPDLDGATVLERLREWAAMPIIVLSVREEEADKVHALDHGADDYVTKPFLMGELLARMRAALRRRQADPDEPVLRFGAVAIDRIAHQVLKNDEPVRLSPLEYRLLTALARYPGRVLTHRQLMRDVWGAAHYEEAAHYLRVYVAHLRKKLEDDPARPRLIVTEPGIGYRLLDPKG